MNTDADGNEIGKLFIGGLSQATNNASLRRYFSCFGEVEEALVMMDNKTGRSRGFGYVKYAQVDSVHLALSAKPHLLDDKEIDAKQCNVHMRGRNRCSLKVFVGGIGLEQTAETLRAFFAQFGSVTDVNLMMDVQRQRHRGFAFVGFEDETIVRQLIEQHFVQIGGRQVEIKAMEPPNFSRRIVGVGTEPNSVGVKVPPTTALLINGARAKGYNNEVYVYPDGSYHPATPVFQKVLTGNGFAAQTLLPGIKQPHPETTAFVPQTFTSMNFIATNPPYILPPSSNFVTVLDSRQATHHPTDAIPACFQMAEHSFHNTPYRGQPLHYGLTKTPQSAHESPVYVWPSDVQLVNTVPQYRGISIPSAVLPTSQTHNRQHQMVTGQNEIAPNSANLTSSLYQYPTYSSVASKPAAEAPIVVNNETEKEGASLDNNECNVRYLGDNQCFASAGDSEPSAMARASNAVKTERPMLRTNGNYPRGDVNPVTGTNDGEAWDRPQDQSLVGGIMEGKSGTSHSRGGDRLLSSFANGAAGDERSESAMSRESSGDSSPCEKDIAAYCNDRMEVQAATPISMCDSGLTANQSESTPNKMGLHAGTGNSGTFNEESHMLTAYSSLTARSSNSEMGRQNAWMSTQVPGGHPAGELIGSMGNQMNCETNSLKMNTIGASDARHSKNSKQLSTTNSREGVPVGVYQPIYMVPCGPTGTNGGEANGANDTLAPNTANFNAYASQQSMQSHQQPNHVYTGYLNSPQKIITPQQTGPITSIAQLPTLPHSTSIAAGLPGTIQYQHHHIPQHHIHLQQQNQQQPFSHALTAVEGPHQHQQQTLVRQHHDAGPSPISSTNHLHMEMPASTNMAPLHPTNGMTAHPQFSHHQQVPAMRGHPVPVYWLQNMSQPQPAQFLSHTESAEPVSLAPLVDSMPANCMAGTASPNLVPSMTTKPISMSSTCAPYNMMEVGVPMLQQRHQPCNKSTALYAQPQQGQIQPQLPACTAGQIFQSSEDAEHGKQAEIATSMQLAPVKVRYPAM